MVAAYGGTRFIHKRDIDCVVALQSQVGQLEVDKDNVYAERNRLVAALSKCFPAHLCRHPDNEDWEDDWRTIVCVHLPTGQATWHIHDSEVPLFSHLGTTDNHWDGHGTDEKYERLSRLPVQVESQADRRREFTPVIPQVSLQDEEGTRRMEWAATWLEYGNTHPYSTSWPIATNWESAAARGIMSNLMTPTGGGVLYDMVSMDEYRLIVKAIADIIEAAQWWYTAKYYSPILPENGD
jgi:hypothetical protein